MSFASPWLLALIPTSLLLIAVSLWRNKQGRGSPLSLLHALLRGIIVTLVAAALASPYSVSIKPAESLTALVDISASITSEQGQAMLTKATQLAQELSVPLRIRAFAKTPAAREVALESAPSYESIRAMWRSLDIGGSDLSAAISNALSETPSSPLLLLSDGYETSGSLRENLHLYTTHPIFPLTAPGEEPSTALSISQLHAPITALSQRSVDVRVTVSNSATAPRTSAPQPARLEVRHGDSTVLTRSLTVAPGEDIPITAQSDPSLEGLQPIQAKLSWQDAQGPHTVTKTIWLSGEKRNKVLLLSGTAEDDRYLSRILTNQAYQLRSVLADPSDTKLIPLEDYRAVVLHNVPFSKLPTNVERSLSSYVDNGGGLVVIGGNTSYGLGGYIGSSLEPILPVRLVPPHQEKKRLNIAVQLVIDKSRSMATDNRLEFAKASAEEVVRTLLDEDYLGVIGFDEVPFIALPLSTLRSVRSVALSRISRLFPTSRTNLFPALDEARRGLANVQAGRKHIIVLTDGKLPDPGPYYLDLVKQARFLGITLSTIMVGNEADDGFLEQLAHAGGGAFYQTADPRSLPRVFLSDVKVASGERTLQEDSQLVVRPGPDPITSTSISSFPFLRGFIQTQEREQATTELLVRSSDGNFPLLASWNVKQGNVIAFTSDANGRWSSEWLRWDRIQEFWTDILESAQKGKERTKNSQMQFDLRSWVEAGEVVIDLALFQEIPSQELPGEITTPQGQLTQVLLKEISSGHYQARIPRAQAGTYRAEIRIGKERLPPVAWEIDAEQFGERPHLTPNISLLSAIASASGGAIDPSANELLPRMKQESARQTYSHFLLIAALIALLCELALRLLFLRYFSANPVRFKSENRPSVLGTLDP